MTPKALQLSTASVNRIGLYAGAIPYYNLCSANSGLLSDLPIIKFSVSLPTEEIRCVFDDI